LLFELRRELCLNMLLQHIEEITHPRLDHIFVIKPVEITYVTDDPIFYTLEQSYALRLFIQRIVKDLPNMRCGRGCLRHYRLIAVEHRTADLFVELFPRQLSRC